MSKPDCQALSEPTLEYRQYCGRYGEGLPVASHAFNAAFKICIGMMTGSLALLADGAHSLVDAITTGLAAMRSPSAREENETAGSTAQPRVSSAMIILFAAVVPVISIAVIVRASTMILRGAASPLYLPALGPALVSILVNIVLSRHGRTTAGSGLDPRSSANAQETRIGLISSFVCLAGVVGAQLGWPLLDPLAAIAIALMIPHVGYGVVRDVMASTGLLSEPRANTADERKKGVALLSVTSNTVLVLGKLVVGLYIGSVSVISEAIHSGVDLLAALIAFFAVRASAHPEDEKHPFGHGKIENLSGTIEAVLIFVAAGWIVVEAAQKLFHPEPIHQVGWGITIMLVSSAVNVLVSHFLFKVGKETDSVALQADAWHLRTDVWTSAGVMAGLAIIWIGQRIFRGFHLYWIDPIAAIGVAFLIFHAAWKLTVESGRDLLDVSLPDEEKRWLRVFLGKWRTKGCECHNLRTRKAGSTRFVEFDMYVEPTLPVGQSSALCENMTQDIRSHFGPNTQVVIHTKPRN
jgi:cation diffusion facilitator family transporter